MAGGLPTSSVRSKLPQNTSDTRLIRCGCTIVRSSGEARAACSMITCTAALSRPRIAATSCSSSGQYTGDAHRLAVARIITMIIPASLSVTLSYQVNSGKPPSSTCHGSSRQLRNILRLYLQSCAVRFPQDGSRAPPRVRRHQPPKAHKPVVLELVNDSIASEGSFRDARGRTRSRP